MTNRLESKRPAILLCFALLIASGALGSIGWDLWTSEIDASPAAAGVAWTTIDLSELDRRPERFKSKPLAAYRQTTERPLFSSTRRPPKPGPAPAKVKQKPKPPSHVPIGQLQLAGVIVTGNEKLALIRSPAAPDGSWHAERDIVGGWKILEIQGNFASLLAGEAREKLPLYVDNIGITLE